MDFDPNKEVKEEKQKFFSKEYLIGLIISTVVTIVMGVGIYFLRYYGAEYGERKVFASLIDAFSISGLLSILFFFIVWVSNYGAFDAISYSILVVWNTMFHKNIRETKVPATYRDYRELKRGKERANVTFMLIPGAIALITGIILLLIYYYA